MFYFFCSICFLVLNILFFLLIIKERSIFLSLLKNKTNFFYGILFISCFVFLVKFFLLTKGDFYFFLRAVDFSKIYILHFLNDIQINSGEWLKHPNFFFSLKYINYLIPIKVFNVQLLNSLIFSFSGILFYFLVEKIFDAKKAFFASVLFLLWPTNSFLSLDTDAAILAIFWTIIALFSLVLSFKEKNNFIFLISLISLIFAITTRANNIIIFLIYIIFLILNYKFLKNKSRILIFLPFFMFGMFYAVVRFFSFLRKSQNVNNIEMNIFTGNFEVIFNNLLINFKNFFFSPLGALFLLGFLFVFFMKNINKKSKIFIFLYFFIIIIFYAFVHVFGLSASRYLVNVTVPGFIMSSLMLDKILNNRKIILTSLLIVFLLFFWNFYLINYSADYNKIETQEYLNIKKYYYKNRGVEAPGLSSLSSFLKDGENKKPLILVNNIYGFLGKINKFSEYYIYGSRHSEEIDIYKFRKRFDKIYKEKKEAYIYYTSLRNENFDISNEEEKKFNQILKILRAKGAKEVFYLEKNNKFSFLYKIN